MLQSSMKITSNTLFGDQLGSKTNSFTDDSEEKTQMNDTASLTTDTEEGGTKFTRVSNRKRKEPNLPNELVNNSQSGHVPPRTSFLSPADKARKKRRVTFLSVVSPSSLNKSVIDSSVLESAEKTSSELENSLNLLPSPKFKCDEYSSTFSTSQELLQVTREEHLTEVLEDQDSQTVHDSSISARGVKKLDRLFSQEDLTLLRSNYKVNKYPSRKDLMQIADALGRSFESVKSWFKKSRNMDRRDGKLPSSKCPDCHKVLSKYESLNRHKKSCQGQRDLVKEKLDAKTKDLNVEGTQEIISKELSDLRNQPPSGQNVDLFEMDFSDSDLRDVLNSDSD